MPDTTMAERVKPYVDRIERAGTIDARDVADGLRLVAQGQDDQRAALVEEIAGVKRTLTLVLSISGTLLTGLILTLVAALAAGVGG